MLINLVTKKISPVDKIDILTDDVTDMMDKLFYRASGGKCIDYAGDTPMPNAVNPLTKEQAIEWGDSAMKIQFQRVSSIPVRKGKRVVSVHSRFSQRSTAEPFYGYKSSPPAAAAFKNEEPVGPAAKALKAAGTLTALASKFGSPTNAYFDMYADIWAEVPEVVKEYVTPDLSESSNKDMIKLVRSTDHAMYGFNADAPTVTIDLGKYKPETMLLNYLFDWHSFALTLRYIGEFIYKYNLERVEPDTVFYASPAYSEGRKYKKFEVSMDYVRSKIVKKSKIVTGIADATMKYYTKAVNAYGIGSKLRSIAANISINSNSDANSAMLLAVHSKQANRRLIIPKNAGVYMDQKAYGDIRELSKPRFSETLDKLTTSQKRVYIPTWHSVHTTVWSWFFQNDFPSKSLLSSLLRRSKHIASFTKDEMDVYKSKVASCIPVGLGLMIRTMLVHMLPDEAEAYAEFAMMLTSLTQDDKISFDMSFDSMYVTAVKTTHDPIYVMGKIHSGFNRYEANAHSASAFFASFKISGDLNTIVIKGIKAFMINRLSYWKNHYSSRMIDCQGKLRYIKSTIKKKGIMLTGRESLRLVDSNEYSVKVDPSLLDLNNQESIKKFVEELKKDAVKYNFLSLCYQFATVHLSDNLKISIRLSSNDVRNIMKKTTVNYARKRETWKNVPLVDASNWKNDMAKLDKMDRINDMINYCDKTLQPPFKWNPMYMEALMKFRKTEKMVNKLLTTKVLDGDEEVENVINSEDNVLVHVPNVIMNEDRRSFYVAGDNRYALLNDEYESYSDGDEEEIVSVEESPNLALRSEKPSDDTVKSFGYEAQATDIKKTNPNVITETIINEVKHDIDVKIVVSKNDEVEDEGSIRSSVCKVPTTMSQKSGSTVERSKFMAMRSRMASKKTAASANNIKVVDSGETITQRYVRALREYITLDENMVPNDELVTRVVGEDTKVINDNIVKNSTVKAMFGSYLDKVRENAKSYAIGGKADSTPVDII